MHNRMKVNKNDLEIDYVLSMKIMHRPIPAISERIFFFLASGEGGDRSLEGEL